MSLWFLCQYKPNKLKVEILKKKKSYSNKVIISSDI